MNVRKLVHFRYFDQYNRKILKNGQINQSTKIPHNSFEVSTIYQVIFSRLFLFHFFLFLYFAYLLIQYNLFKVFYHLFIIRLLLYYLIIVV